MHVILTLSEAKRKDPFALRRALTALAVIGVVACDSGPRKPPSLHQYTQSYDFTISPDQAPPHAREDVHYTPYIFDRKTREPLVNGEGQLFAGIPVNADIPNGPQSKTWDALADGPEAGTDRAK